jgi:glycosyltransferase involved in cell wall biosynthesis
MIGKLPDKKSGRGTEYMSSVISETIWPELTNLHKYNIVLLPGADDEDFLLAKKMPTIIWMHVPAYRTPDHVSRFFEDYAVLENTVAYVVQSNFHKKNISEEYDIPLSKIYVINNTFEPIPYVPKSTKNVELVYISQPSRGLDILLSAFANVKDESLKLTVTGCACEECKAEVPEMNFADSRVSFPGFVPRDEYIRNLQKASIYIYPCRFEETAGIGIMEALSAGIKVVTTTLGALPETTLGHAKLIKHMPVFVENQDALKEKFVKIFTKEIKKAVKEVRKGKFKPEKQISDVLDAFSLKRVQDQWRDFNSQM